MKPTVMPPLQRAHALARIRSATGYWLGASATMRTVHGGEQVGGPILRLEKVVRIGGRFPVGVVERLVSARNG